MLQSSSKIHFMYLTPFSAYDTQTIRYMSSILHRNFGLHRVKFHLLEDYCNPKLVLDYSSFLNKMLVTSKLDKRDALITSLFPYVVFKDFIENFEKKSGVDKNKDIILCSGVSTSTFYYIEKLLQSGYKVAYGGQVVNTLFPKVYMFRNYLKLMGFDENLLKNIIFIRGFLTPEIPLDKILNFWKDIELPEPKNFNFLAECKYDKFLEEGRYNYDTRMLLMDYNVSRKNKLCHPCLFLKIGCNWNRCKYCLSKNFKRKNTFVTTEEKLLKHIKYLVEYYGDSNICIYDAEIDTESMKLLSELQGINILFMFTSIEFFKYKEFLVSLNNFLKENTITMLFVGFESFISRMLKEINRNYDSNDLYQCFSNLKKIVQQNFNNIHCVKLAIIKDLPFENTKELVKHYIYIFELLKYLNDKDGNITSKDFDQFKFLLNVNYMMLFPLQKYSNYIDAENDKINSDLLCGYFKCIETYFSMDYFSDLSHLKYRLLRPFYRITKDNKFLKSDNYYLPEILDNCGFSQDILNFIL